MDILIGTTIGLFIMFFLAYVAYFFMEKDIEDYKIITVSDLELLISLEQNMNCGVDGRCIPYNNKIILNIGNMPDIKTTSMVIYGFKYHIEGIGLIPFWYKSHKIINKIYKIKRSELLKEKKRKRKNEIKEKLGIN